MTVKPETKFGHEVRKNIKAFWLPFTITATAGIPDLIGIKNRVAIFLELKCIKQNSINITPTQISLNSNIFEVYGKNYFLVKHIEQRIIKLYDGDKGRELKEQGWKYGDGTIPPYYFEFPYDWERMTRLMFS